MTYEYIEICGVNPYDLTCKLGNLPRAWECVGVSYYEGKRYNYHFAILRKKVIKDDWKKYRHKKVSYAYL